MRSEFIDKIDTQYGSAYFFKIQKLEEFGYELDRLPISIKILLENALRHYSKFEKESEAIYEIAEWPKSIGHDIQFMPYRILLQDYTGVPLIVDLAAMRDAAINSGLEASIIDTKVPVDLIIDHSIQVDSWEGPSSIELNLDREYERNSERYSLLKWAQSSFKGLRVFPPGKGICHQVNLEYLAKVVAVEDTNNGLVCFPDTVLGTDSHTTMINGLGVIGWGVGGIEAEAVMLGEPYYMQIPRVLGVRLEGEIREGVTTTDIVLTVTQRLRERDVVGAFVEFFGEGVSRLNVPDRATIGNMSPEYGATIGFFPVDYNTLSYLIGTGREKSHVELVRQYCIKQGMFATKNYSPSYSEVIKLDLSEVEPSVSGPRNPDERVSLSELPRLAKRIIQDHRDRRKGLNMNNGKHIQDGSIVIASITSCTNTSNPTVMIGAALLAKRAYEYGLRPKEWVKRSLAPGSGVVTEYLSRSGLLKYLESLGFNVVGYGCTTCIGNSGPLKAEIESDIIKNDIYTVAVLSGNRNFDGRIHPLVKGSFLMSPMLVVAYSLAGTIDFDFKQPIGISRDGSALYLSDIWPRMEEINEIMKEFIRPELYIAKYSNSLEGDDRWRALKAGSGIAYSWDERSTYIRKPPWFDESMMKSTKKDIIGARVLALLEDKVSTDHISPAGMIPIDSPAGRYLISKGIDLINFSTYGARRGNHEVMVRGGFSNLKLRNLLVKGREGGFTRYFPTGEIMTIYDASLRYASEGIPLIIIAGKMYGAGSSRDWAAKATRLLGVRAVIAESFERIHRSNLIAMGVLPLQFDQSKGWRELGLNGEEIYYIRGIEGMKRPRERLSVTAIAQGHERSFEVTAMVENETEIEYLEKGGLLPYIFNKIRR